MTYQRISQKQHCIVNSMSAKFIFCSWSSINASLQLTVINSTKAKWTTDISKQKKDLLFWYAQTAKQQYASVRVLSSVTCRYQWFLYTPLDVADGHSPIYSTSILKNICNLQAEAAVEQTVGNEQYKKKTDGRPPSLSEIYTLGMVAR